MVGSQTGRRTLGIRTRLACHDSAGRHRVKPGGLLRHVWRGTERDGSVESEAGCAGRTSSPCPAAAPGSAGVTGAGEISWYLFSIAGAASCRLTITAKSKPHWTGLDVILWNRVAERCACGERSGGGWCWHERKAGLIAYSMVHTVSIILDGASKAPEKLWHACRVMSALQLDEVTHANYLNRCRCLS